MPTTPSGIYYASRGSGKPLLFVHGSGADHMIWGHQLKGLSDEFRVVALDLNGHLKSAYREGDGLKTYSQDVLDVMADIGEPVLLLGHSLGGAVALNVALEHPQKLYALGLIGTGARLKVLPELLEMIENDFERACDMILEWEFHTTPPDEIMSAAREQIINNGQQALSRDFNTCNAFDVSSRLAEITLPTLVVCGREDKLTPVKYSEYFLNNIETASLEIIEQAGHNVMLERPDALNGAIRNYVQAL